MEQFLMEIIAQKALDRKNPVQVRYSKDVSEGGGPSVVWGYVVQVEEKFCQVRTPGSTPLNPAQQHVCYYMFMEEIEIIQSHN